MAPFTLFTAVLAKKAVRLSRARSDEAWISLGTCGFCDRSGAGQREETCEALVTIGLGSETPASVAIPRDPHLNDDSPPRPSSVTQALERLRTGDHTAFHEIAPLVYEELRSMARREMNSQGRSHTLQATDLVNAAFERLLRQEQPHWKDRTHFISAAVCAMRCVLVDHARRKGRARHGSGIERLPLDDIVDEIEERTTDILVLDESLRRMAAMDARMALVAECALFGDLGVAETARALRISVRTVQRELQSARAWLRKEHA